MRYDLVIVGMGSGGMPAAEFAATLPLRVAVVERERVGGDCLWTGCVPSKALLSSAKAAHAMRIADLWGLPAVDPEIDTEAVWKRVRAVQEDIAATDDDPERYRRMGIEVVHGDARLVGPREVAVGDQVLRTRFILLCTGSRPVVPPIEGLAEAGFLTNETVFTLERAPRSVVFLGGGPIAIELAQALGRLGVRVTVLQKGGRILPRDEPDLAERLLRLVRGEGLDVQLGAEARRVTVEGGSKVVHALVRGEERSFAADELFVAVGRRPDLTCLGLDEIGVETSDRGVVVDGRMRTSVASVYAAGDVVGGAQFTHAAAVQAVRAVRDMFFPGRGEVTDLIPWCTFTDPELAHVGLTEAEAAERHGARKVEAHRFELSHSDRARAEGHAEGAIVAVTAKGALVGASVLAPTAGEMIHELALAVDRGLSLGDLARLVHVYPTYATSVAQLAAESAYEGARRYGWLVRAGRWFSDVRAGASG